VINALAIVLMAFGLAGVLRAVVIISTSGDGRFPLDPWISMLVGFGLLLLGQTLLRSE
jgi:hypothetical protein